MKNAAAAAAVVVLACTAYALLPEHRRHLAALYGSPAFSFTGWQFLAAAASGYVAVLATFFLSERAPLPSKPLRCLALMGRFARTPRATIARGLDSEDRLALLSTLLKGFFGPLMVMSLMAFCMGAVEHGRALATDAASWSDLPALLNRHGFWFAMQLILFVDVLVFTVGYLVELPALGNTIRSVDSTLLGWGAALLCYPPFNHATALVLGSVRTDFPQFDDPTAHLLLNALLLALMALYAWASVALGFKASNLTHRGIVARGPYRVIRHPAYVCKNLAWWIGSLPPLALAFGHSTYEGVQALASVAGWTALYVLRALTEEDHLRRVDGGYAAYAAQVRYRFVPGLV